MSSLASMGRSASLAGAAPGVRPADVPFWARPAGVAAILAVWCLVHAVIGAGLESAANADDAIESYLVQSLELSYVPRNPPLFDWLLYGLQQVLGTGLLSFAVLRYALLFSLGVLVYRIARQMIADPRLQALATFSLSTLWVVGYHSHRILTHSNVMIVAIAGTFLTLMAITRRPGPVLYAGLGAWIAAGLLGKFGFVAFLGVLIVAGLLEPRFRHALLDRRLLVTVLVAALPLAVYAYALHALKQDVGAATAQTIGGTHAPWNVVLNTFVQAWGGYLLPLIGLMALVFLPYNRGEEPRDPGEAAAAARRVLRTIMLLGTAVTLIGVLAVGTTSLRDRYFHVFFVLAPVYLFAELERIGGWQGRVRLYLGLLLALAVGVVGVRLAITLWPDPRLCGRCIAAEPLYKLKEAVIAKLGPAPTLVADDRTSAGRLRAAIPDARVVIVHEPDYRPPPRPATGCARVSGIFNGLPQNFLPPAETATRGLTVKWWSPLLRPARWSDWQFTPLDPADPRCR